MKKLRKVIAVIFLTVEILRIVWNYYDTHADEIRELIRDAKASLDAMKQAKQRLLADAGRHLAMRVHAKLSQSLKPQKGGDS